MCRFGLLRPDGSEEPNPFDPDGPEAWSLTPELQREAGFIAALFHKVIMDLATSLADRGVPVDPGWPSDQALIGILLLLPAAGYEIPWDGPITELADQLQPAGVSSILRNGRGGDARDGRSEKMATNAERIRKHIRAGQGGRDLSMLYAGGKTRALPKVTRVRQGDPPEDLRRVSGHDRGQAPTDLRLLQGDHGRPAAVRTPGPPRAGSEEAKPERLV